MPSNIAVHSQLSLKETLALKNKQANVIPQTIAPQHCNHAELYRLSEQLHPYLKRTEIPSSQSFSFSADVEKPIANHPISIVYQNLQHAYPKAGNHYWAHKCWQLAIWQPVLLSFICVYGLKTSVAINQLIVRCYDTTIAGYQLPCNEHYNGTTQALISHISNQCQQLIHNFYLQINQLFPLKFRFCQRLLSDQILSAMAKTAQYLPSLSTAEIDTHTDVWLTGFKLKKRPLLLTPTGEAQRSSCCLEYRLDQADYCSNCPKEKEKRHAAT